MVNRVERKPERNNKIYVQRVYPGLNIPKPVKVNPKYVSQEKKQVQVVEVNEEVIINPPIQKEEEIFVTKPQKPKGKGKPEIIDTNEEITE